MPTGIESEIPVGWPEAGAQCIPCSTRRFISGGGSPPGLRAATTVSYGGFGKDTHTLDEATSELFMKLDLKVSLERLESAWV